MYDYHRKHMHITYVYIHINTYLHKYIADIDTPTYMLTHTQHTYTHHAHTLCTHTNTTHTIYVIIYVYYMYRLKVSRSWRILIIY